MIRLVKALYRPALEGFEKPYGEDTSNRGFGQVVALVLLAAPFFTLAGYFADSEFPFRIACLFCAKEVYLEDIQDPNRSRTTDSRPSEIEISEAQGQTPRDSHSGGSVVIADEVDDPHAPNTDWKHQRRTLGCNTIFSVTVCIFECIILLLTIAGVSFQTSLSPIDGILDILANFHYVTPFTGLFLMTLNSLLIQDLVPPTRSSIRTLLESSNLCTAFLPLSTLQNLVYAQPFALMVYIGVCLLLRFLKK